MKDECINCGAWKGLHHYETNQCPRNGQEAPLGKLQEWDNTVYQEDNTSDLRATIDEQAATIARLTADAKLNDMAWTDNQAALKQITAALEDIKYYVGNPSAWEYYDDGVSEKIRAILKAAGMA